MSAWVAVADAGVRLARWCLARAGYRLAWQVARLDRTVELPPPVTGYADIRVTPILRSGQYTFGWKVRAESPEAAAALFCQRFLPSDHQQSRRASQ